MEPVDLRDWTLEIGIDPILRGQGADPDVVRAHRPALMEAAEWALKEGLPLLKPAVQIRELDVIGFNHERLLLETGLLSGQLVAQHLAGARRVILMICTLGPMLETIAGELIQTDPLLGFALDGLGNAAIVELSQKVSRSFELKAESQGWHSSIPLSPGMVGWNLGEGQKQIFSLLLPDRIGVSLNVAGMMTPTKSVSQVLGMGAEMLGGRSCDYCSLRETCRYQDHYHQA